MYTRTLVASVAVAITLLLSSCGGGGGGSDAPVPVPTVQTPPASSDIAVSGFVAKGTITGGVVRATQYVNGVATAVVREATLGPDGSFLLSMPRGVTLLQLIAGSDTKSKDEATGAQVPLPTDFIMRSIIDTTGLAAESAIAHLTPFTELTTTVAQRFGGFVTGSVAAAQSGVASLIGADPATTKPIQIDILDSLKATAQEQRVSILNAAVSNIAAVGGMGCGDKATYGGQIGCVVSKISDGIELTASNTAQSTLKLGTQSFQEMAAAVAEIKNVSSQVVATVVNVLDTVKYVYSDDLAWNSAKQEVDSSIQEQIVSSRLYLYAHLSDLIYSVDPTASDSSIFTSASDSQSASLPSGWRVIDWSVFGSAARPSNYSASGLAFNVFVNAEIRQLVFAYSEAGV